MVDSHFMAATLGSPVSPLSVRHPFMDSVARGQLWASSLFVAALRLRTSERIRRLNDL
jgi:hypothetical protein